MVSETALRTLAELDKKTAERIKSSLTELENDPFQPRPKADIKKLHGFGKPEMYRLRIGDFRAIYFIINKDVNITSIITRGKGYEWLD